MLTDKAYRHYHKIFHSLLSQFLQGIFGVGLQPFNRSNAALVGEGEGVGMAELLLQLLKDEFAAGHDLPLIGISGVLHIALGYTVGAEEDMRSGRIFTGLYFASDQIGQRLDVARMVVPAPNAADWQAAEGRISIAQALQLPEARATGADREVRVERQHNHLIDSIGLEVGYCRFGERMPVAHGYIAGGIHSLLSQAAL